MRWLNDWCGLTHLYGDALISTSTDFSSALLFVSLSLFFKYSLYRCRQTVNEAISNPDTTPHELECKTIQSFTSGPHSNECLLGTWIKYMPHRERSYNLLLISIMRENGKENETLFTWDNVAIRWLSSHPFLLDFIVPLFTNYIEGLCESVSAHEAHFTQLNSVFTL